MLKAILFDVDGVLLDSFKANFQFFHNLLTTTGYTPPTLDEYKNMFHLSMVDVIRKVTNLTSETEIKRIRDIAEKSETMYPVELVSMPEDTKPTIKALSRDYPLGLVTSRIRVGVDGLPQLAELKEFLSVIITHEDTKEHKPYPEPLLLAADKLQIKPENIVYVGDAKTDFAAAKSAGMKIVMYKNNLEGADGYINTLAELPEIINSL